MKRIIALLAATSLLLLLAAIPTTALPVPDEPRIVPLAEIPPASSELPFAPGERLHFSLMWERITVAEAVLAVERFVDLAGRPALHISMTAKTRPFFDFFYKVRDRIDSFVTPDARSSLYLNKKQREGGYRREYTVRFDQQAGRAFYESSSGNEKITEIMPGRTLDELAVYYYFRLIPSLEAGQTLTSPVTDGKKFVIGEARVVRRETVTVEAGTFDAFLVEPDLQHLGGVFKQSDDAVLQIWVTADDQRIPVKIRSKVAVGHFNAELARVEGLKGSMARTEKAENKG